MILNLQHWRSSKKILLLILFAILSRQKGLKYRNRKLLLKFGMELEMTSRECIWIFGLLNVELTFKKGSLKTIIVMLIFRGVYCRFTVDIFNVKKTQMFNYFAIFYSKMLLLFTIEKNQFNSLDYAQTHIKHYLIFTKGLSDALCSSQCGKVNTFPSRRGTLGCSQKLSGICVFVHVLMNEYIDRWMNICISDQKCMNIVMSIYFVISYFIYDRVIRFVCKKNP